MYTDYYDDKDDYYGEKERFSVSNKDLSIFPLYVLVMDASTKIKSSAKKSNLLSKYKSSLNSKNPAKELIDFVNDEDELNGSLDSDLNQLKSLVSYNSNDWFVTFGGASGNELDAKDLSNEIKGMKGESAKLRRLMRENRRLRQGLRESDDVVKVGSDNDNSFYIYDVTPLVDRTVEPGEEVAGYIELYNGKDLKVLMKNSIKAYNLDLDDPVDKSINDDLEDVIKKAKSDNIYAVVTDEFREPDVNKIKRALKRAI